MVQYTEVLEFITTITTFTSNSKPNRRVLSFLVSSSTIQLLYGSKITTRLHNYSSFHKLYNIGGLYAKDHTYTILCD